MPTTTCPRYTSSLRCGISAGARATYPRQRVRRARTSRFLCGPGSRRSSRSGSSTPCALPSAYPRSDALTRQPTPPVAGRGRRRAGRRRMDPLVVRPLRRRLAAGVLRPLSGVGRDPARGRDHAPGLRRASVSTTAGGATCPRRTCGVRFVAWRLPSLPRFWCSRSSTSTPRRCRAASGSSTCSSFSRSSWGRASSRGRSSRGPLPGRSSRVARKSSSSAPETLPS